MDDDKDINGSSYNNTTDNSIKVDSETFVKRILELLVLISFIILTVIVGKNHEPWADEAQAWLLARDASIKDLITVNMRYEGSPVLWHMLLKVFIKFGLTYEFLYIVPIIFTSIGVAIFEFKVKAPTFLKIVLPFTYYIFFQYTIVARSYCLVFPTLMYLAAVWKYKTDKPILFAIGVAILLSISTHCLLLASCISLLYGIQVVLLTLKKLFKKGDIATSRIIKNWIMIVALLALFGATAYFLITPADHEEFRNSEESRYRSADTLLADSLVTNAKDPKICMIISITIVCVLYMAYWRDKRFFELLLYFVPIYLFLAFFYCNKWHIGLLFEVITFCLIIHDKLSDMNWFATLYMVCCCIQVFYSYNSGDYDYHNLYSASYQVAEYLKNNELEDKKIYALGYSTTAILPYFDYNPFNNIKSGKTYCSWKKDDPDSMTIEEIKEDMPDVFVISNFRDYNYIGMLNRLESNKIYEKYTFVGNTYIKDDIYETESFYIFVSQNLLKSENNETEYVYFNSKISTE